MSGWTVLIAAAGRGTRLDFDKPKILFSVGGQTILQRLVNLFSPFCGDFVFVLSPDGAPIVEPFLPPNSRIAIQQEPKGMGDAVAAGAPSITTEFAVLVWGDQVALRPRSLDHCMKLLEGSARAEAVCPTLLRAQPYIHFPRDPQTGEVTGLLQQREGDEMPAEGESDAGVFFFRTEALKRRLRELPGSSEATGRRTKELNFLPILPLIARTAGALLTPQIMTEVESIGVNSREDADRIERELAKEEGGARPEPNNSR